MRTMKALGASKSMLQQGVVLLAATVCFAAQADEAYLAVVDPDPNNNSFTNCVNWRIGSVDGASLGTAADPIKPAYDYIVPKGKSLRTPTSSTTFGGKSLTINGVLAISAGGSGREYTFNGDGLILDGGLVESLWGGSPVVRGTVTIAANTTVQMFDSLAGSSLGFNCSLSGQSTSTIWAYGNKDTKCTVRFKGSTLSGYLGSIVGCTQDYAHRNAAPVPAQATTISIGTVETSASVTIRPYCTITAESAGDVISLASLEMKTNSTLTVVYDKSSKIASCIKVTSTFTHNEGPVKIDVTGNGTANDCEWPDSELPILKAPAGITLSTNDFIVVAAWPAYDLNVRTTEDGLSTLCIKQCGRVIKQSVKDTYSDRTTSTFVAGDHWEGGCIPDMTNCYYAPLEQRAFADFPGRVLARNSGTLGLQVQSVRIDDFRVINDSSGGVLLYNFRGGEVKLSGHIHLINAGNKICMFGHGSTLTVASEIDGNGGMNIRWSNNATPPTKNVCTVQLLGTNDCYTGKIWADHVTSSKKDGVTYNYTTSDDGYHCVLSFADGRSLGGAMPSWTYDGHKLNDYLYLTPLASTTLERENCGILVDGFARIVCNDGITLTIKEKTTWKGELKKLGAGTLAWGGAAPSFTTDGGTTPVADKNLLVIAEGTLRPASSEAFRGVAVTIADGAGIGVEVSTDATSDLVKYGMDLRPSGSSLTIEAASLTPVVSIPVGARGPLHGAICTVPSASAAALRGKLVQSYTLPGDKYVKVFERVNEDTSVTFAVKATKLATIIMVY